MSSQSPVLCSKAISSSLDAQYSWKLKLISSMCTIQTETFLAKRKSKKYCTCTQKNWKRYCTSWHLGLHAQKTIILLSFDTKCGKDEWQQFQEKWQLRKTVKFIPQDILRFYFWECCLILRMSSSWSSTSSHMVLLSGLSTSSENLQNFPGGPFWSLFRT